MFLTTCISASGMASRKSARSSRLSRFRSINQKTTSFLLSCGSALLRLPEVADPRLVPSPGVDDDRAIGLAFDQIHELDPPLAFVEVDCAGCRRSELKKNRPRFGPTPKKGLVVGVG